MHRRGIGLNGSRWQISASRWPTGSQPAARKQLHIRARWQQTAPALRTTDNGHVYNGEDDRSCCFRGLNWKKFTLWVCLLTESEQNEIIFNSPQAKKASYFLLTLAVSRYKSDTVPVLSAPLAARLFSIVQSTITLIPLKHLRHHREDGDWVGLAAVLLPCRSGEI